MNDVWKNLNLQFPWPKERPNVPGIKHRWCSKDKLGRFIGYRKILEIGSWLGGSVEEFLINPNAKIVCVDPWEPWNNTQNKDDLLYHISKQAYQIFMRNLWEYRDRVIAARVRVPIYYKALLIPAIIQS